MDLLTISPSQSFWKQNHLLEFPPSCQFYPSMATEGGVLAGSWTDGEMMIPSPRRTSDDRSTQSLPYSISTGERVTRHSLSTDSQTSQEYPETQMVYSDQDMDVNPAGGTNNIGVCGDFGQLADFRQYLYNGSDQMQGDLVDHAWMGRSQYIADDLSFMFPSHQRECKFSSPTSLTNIKRSMPSAHKEICAGCQRPIEDRFLLKVMEFSWHEHCVVCSICHAPLSGTCYQRDRKFFCKLDYDKMYRHPCNGCGMHVGSNELVMRAQGFIYHLHCFACVECGQHLKQGDYYALHEGQLFCRLDHEREFMMNLSPKSDDSESYEDCESDGGKHPKRPRTILTTSQRRKFKSAFELNPKPCRKVREQLAAETGLSVRVVQVWFQNQRAKVKKLARRQSQDGNSKNNSGKSKGGDVNKNENCKHETKKEYKDDDDDQDCLKRLGEDESLGSLISESRHHGNVEQISPIPASEYQESHFGNTMDIGNTVRQTLDDSMTCLDHMFVGEGVPNTASIENNGVVNPIDKLYSMQSSYFSIE